MTSREILTYIRTEVPMTFHLPVDSYRTIKRESYVERTHPVRSHNSYSSVWWSREQMAHLKGLRNRTIKISGVN